MTTGRNVSFVSTQGQLKYNGFRFPPALRSSIDATPVYDKSKRSLMYVRYALKVEFVITLQDTGYLGEVGAEAANYYPYVDLAGDGNSSNLAIGGGGEVTDKHSIDPALAHLRRRLMQPARHLRCSDMGFGYELNINDPYEPNGLHDVSYGPKPQSMSWKPIAANKAASVQYEIEFCIPECEVLANGVKEQKPTIFNVPQAEGALPVEIMGVTYNQSWDIDDCGHTTKNYQALIKIRGYVDPNKLTEILRSADDYRKYFEPPLLNGYIRTRKYSLNDDKSELVVNIEDKEHHTSWPLPPGSPDISVDYTIQSGIAQKSTFTNTNYTGWKVWVANLSGRMKLAKGFDPYYRRLYPYYVFLLIIRSRFALKMMRAGEEGGQEVGWTGFAGGEGGFSGFQTGSDILSLPVSFTMSESVFGREFSFNFQWELIGCRPQEAPFMLRFGCDPTRYMENQNRGDTQQSWNWKLWNESLYHPYDKEGWSYRITVEVPADNYPPVRDSYIITQGIIILQDWDPVERPAFNMRGAKKAAFEGDARQEPCQNSPDFWYQVREKTNKSFSEHNTPEYVTKDYDKNGTILHHESSVEIIENHQNAKTVPLDMPEDPTDIGESQDGHKEQKKGSSYSEEAPYNAGAYGGVIPLDGMEQIGDRQQVADTTTSRFSASSQRAGQIQSHGPQTYRIRVTGQALSIHLPTTPPRTMRWGEGYAVCSQKRNKITRKGGGEQELWLSQWDMEYDIIGSPNGLSPVALQGNKKQMNPRLVKSPIFTKSQTNFIRNHYT
tara:strand:- start:2409 stop:4739 length:2331 start_codon:yes stop_codon:yes gene_type:complete